MTDPLDVLALSVDRPLPGTEPAPAFTAALRARLERALLLPDRPSPSDPVVRPGGAMTTTAGTSTLETSTLETSAPETSAPETSAGPAPALSPYLAVADARAAVAFYVAAFGAVPQGDPYVRPDGRIGHAEVRIGAAVLMLADEFPELGLLGPLARGGVSTTLHLAVPDVDAVVARAVDAGASLERPADDAPYGRTAVVRDPAGHRWMLQTPPAPAAPAAPAGSAGDVAYVTLAVPGSQRARAFYGAVLGWTFSPGTVEDGWSVDGATPHVGLWGGADEPGVQLCFSVPDVARALAAVRDGGGTGDEPAVRPYGLLAECTDPSGLRFQLWQPS